MSTDLYVFKVKLKYRKSIWRKIAIRGDQTLRNLHDAIFQAFDRWDEHLYSFYFTKIPTSKSKSRLHGVPEYSDPLNEHARNAEQASISELRLKPKAQFEYLFDYGDQWWHELVLEAVEAPEPGETYPKIVAARGDSPPQYPDMEE